MKNRSFVFTLLTIAVIFLSTILFASVMTILLPECVGYTPTTPVETVDAIFTCVYSGGVTALVIFTTIYAGGLFILFIINAVLIIVSALLILGGIATHIQIKIQQLKGEF